MKTIILLFGLLITTASFGQKMKVTEGNISNLKGIEQFDVIFDYSDLQIPKYKSEEAFLEDKMALREEKSKGSGEIFKKGWFRDREEKYEPKFRESFNKRFKNGEISISYEGNAEYVIKVHTQKLYAGYNVGVWRHNAEISAKITVYAKENPEKILLKGFYKNVQGYGAMGNDYESGYRISECYAKLAKEFAYYIKKKAK